MYSNIVFSLSSLQALRTIYVEVITLPGVGSGWQLNHQEKHLSDDTLGMYIPQTPVMPV